MWSIFTTKPRWARQKCAGSSCSRSSSRVRHFDCPSKVRVTIRITPSSMAAKQISAWLTSSSLFCACTITLAGCGVRSAPCGRFSNRRSASSCDSMGESACTPVPAAAPAPPPAILPPARPPAGPGRRSRTTPGNSAPRPLHRFNHAVAVKRLQQVIHCIHVESAHGVLVIGGSKDNLWQWLSFLAPTGASPCANFCPVAIHQPLDHRKSVQSRHLHIQKHQVGMVLLDQVHGLNAVGPLPNNFNVPHRVEQILQLFAGQLFVVDDERRDRHAEVRL